MKGNEVARLQQYSVLHSIFSVTLAQIGQ